MVSLVVPVPLPKAMAFGPEPHPKANAVSIQPKDVVSHQTLQPTISELQVQEAPLALKTPAPQEPLSFVRIATTDGKMMAVRSDLVAAKGGLSFNEGVLGNFTKHAFAGGRHADLGLSVETMTSKGMNLIENNMSLLKAGDNTLIGNINGIQKSFKAFVKDGKIMSVNMYPGVSNRMTQGTVINFGNITW